MMLSDQALDALLKRLHLANTRRAWRDLTRRAEQEDWTYRDFLTLLVSEEIAHRQQTRLDRLVRRARFPFLKTIDDFNFTYQSTVRLSLLGSALASDFVTDGRCLILSGKPGRGKTHLAVAIAYRAIQNGFDARFVTAAELIDDLSAAFRGGRLADGLRDVHPSRRAGRRRGGLSHVRHRRREHALSRRQRSASEEARDDLHHEQSRSRPGAASCTTRTSRTRSSIAILERGRFLTLDGPSMRTKHLGLDDPTSSEASHQRPESLTPGIRISGIDAPEFPEPTPSRTRPRSRRCC